MTALPPWLRRFLVRVAWLVLALGLTAGLLAAAASATAEYMPLVRAAAGVAGLGIGYLLGQAVRPLARWRPPVPVSAESAAPAADSLGRVWLRGFTAGFWALTALGMTLALLSLLLASSLPLGPAISVPLYAFGALLLLPMAIARAMVAGGEGLPRWTLAAAAAAGFTSGLGLNVAIGMLATRMGMAGFGAAGDIATLLALLVLPVTVLGMPVLARDLRPSLQGPAWSGLLALLPLGAAWLLSHFMGAWMSLMGSATSWFWLVPGSVLWGGSLGALLAVAVARGRTDRSPGAGRSSRRVRPLLLAAGALGFFLLGLLPLALWLATIAAPGVFQASTPPTAPIGGSSGFPAATQTGMLPIPGPPLQSPAAGVTLTGPFWSFSWRSPSGASPRDLYQFVLWSPGATRPLTQLVLPGLGLRISSTVVSSHPSVSAPWVWRVRVVRPGQGAGQWSEARPFTSR